MLQSDAFLDAVVRCALHRLPSWLSALPRMPPCLVQARRPCRCAHLVFSALVSRLDQGVDRFAQDFVANRLPPAPAVGQGASLGCPCFASVVP